MSLVPARDHLGEFLLLLETTNGRDKLSRLIQYSTKFAKWRAEESKASESTIKTLGELYAAMALVRKVLRFFRTIAILRQIRAAIPADTSKIDLALFLNLCAKFALANYFLWDHFMFANKIGAWKPSDPKQLEMMSMATEGSWLAEITFSLLENIVRFINLSSAASTPAVELARNAALRGIVRNAVDFPLAAHFMKLFGLGDPSVPHGIFGICGTISSSISLWEMWPTIVVGVKKA